ncbi:hypothetical protein KKC82_06610 [bacterium]|nr:hypothetical protein [bacterium]
MKKQAHQIQVKDIDKLEGPAGIMEAKMIYVSEDAVEKVSEELNKKKYDLKALFKEIKKENPRIAEYIQVQAQKSKNSLEIIGTGIVVYLLLKKQIEIDEEFGTNTELEDFLRALSPEDLLNLEDM